MLQIGGVASGALSEVTKAIIEVAQCSPVPEVALAALEALQKLGSVDGTTISNCTFSGAETAAQANQVPTYSSEHKFEWEK